MRHRHKNKILGRTYSPRKALLQHLAESLVLYEHIETTTGRAQAVQPFVERLVTIGKDGTLVSRRRLLQLLGKPNAVKKIMEVLAPRYKERAGGYTRRIHTRRRQGDAAELTSLSFVEATPATAAKKTT